MKLRKRLLSGIAGFAAAAAITLTPAAAFAAGGPGQGGGGAGHGGGGGTGETETVTNNLSVPTIFVGSAGFGLTNPALQPPDGNPTYVTTTPVPGWYYIQGQNKWQAQYQVATSAKATAAWGDNLTGSAALRPGHPIRVELGLMNSDETAPAMDGYTVVKLEPNALDRDSSYGTLAQSSTGPATPTTFAATQQRVYDSGVTFSIKNVATGAYVVPAGTPATAEINATGNIVYGYNLRVTSAGQYTITFAVPTVTLTGTDAGSFTTHAVSLTITVKTGGGGR